MLRISKLSAIAMAMLFHINVYAVDGSLGEIVVTANRQPQRINEVLADVTVIDREAIEQIGQGTVADLLSRQAGIQTVPLGGPGSTTDFQLRGARSEQTKILIDGVPVNTMDTKGSPLRTLSLSDVERIEILRGPASAVYGSDAIGGVIQIITRKAEKGLHGELFAGTGSHETNSSAANVSFANETWSARLFGSNYQTAGISALTNGRNRDGDADGYKSRNGGANLAFRPAAGHEIAVSMMTTNGVLHSDSASTNSKSNSYDNKTEFHNSVLNLSSSNRITEYWTSLLRYGVNVQDDTSYSRNTTGVNGTVVVSPLRTENHTVDWQNDIALPLGNGLILIEHQDQHGAPADRFSAARDLSSNAFQLGWNASVGDHSWQLSGRHDDNSEFGTKNTGGASYGYQFVPGWRGHVSAATSFRAPTLYQLYATLPLPTSLIANPSLQPETGRNYEIALTHAWGVQLVTLTGFRNRVTNLIDANTISLGGGNTQTQYRNISAVDLQGWTLSYQGQIEDWKINSSLDLLDATDRSTGIQLKRRAKKKFALAADHDWGKWNTGFELVAVGRRYDTDTQTRPMGGYALANVTMRYAFTPLLDIELRGDNVTDKRYINAYSTTGVFIYNVPGASYFIGLRYKM